VRPMANPKEPKTEVVHYRYVPAGKERYDVVRETYSKPTKVEVIDREVSLVVARGTVRLNVFKSIEARETKGEM
jgi:hypothetical protein